MRSRLRPFLGLLATTVLVPLIVSLLGLWEQQRGAADWADLMAERLRLAGIVQQLEARMPPDGRPDYGLEYSRNGQLFGGPLALSEAREAREEVATLVTIMDLRRWLPPVVIWAAGLSAGLSVLVLLAGALLGWLGRISREVLVRGFALVRRGLPAVLAAQVLLGTSAFVAAVAFEAAALAQPGLGSGEVKMLVLAAAMIIGSLVVAGGAIAGLRRALAAFEPDPLTILGRLVSPTEAPGLWRLVERLADRLGALKPDAVVVGLTGGFFVSAGAKVLEPGGTPLSGRTLYLPLPYLPLLRADELAAIIGHELAHFAGGDTDYTLRFLPIYAGVGRSLDAVFVAGGGSGSSLGFLSPTLRLGLFVMDQFHRTVRHWSRAREFAADIAGAGLTSPEAAVRALLRTGAAQPRIDETLAEAARQPDGTKPDLVTAVLDRAVELGLDDPAAYLGAEQPHPTDTHPPTRQRIAKLGVTLTPDLLVSAEAVSPRAALDGLAAYFADPPGLCRAASADFLAVMQLNDEAYATQLAVTAAKVGTEELALHESTRPGAVFLVVAGGIFVAAGLALALFGFSGLGVDEGRLVAAVPFAGGVGFGGFGLLLLSRGERAFMILRPEVLAVPGLDQPIAWDRIADMDFRTFNTRVTTRLLLAPDKPFPQRVPGTHGVKLDIERGIVTITAVLPRKMKPRAFADLLDSYRQAARARRVLAERSASPSRLASDDEAM